MTPLERRRAHVRLLRQRVAVGSVAATLAAGGLVAVLGSQPAATQASTAGSTSTTTTGTTSTEADASSATQDGWSDVAPTDSGTSSSSSSSSDQGSSSSSGLTTGQS